MGSSLSADLVPPDWMDVAVRSMPELCSSTLGIESTLLSQERGRAELLNGSILALAGRETVQVGIFLDDDGCGHIARSLLGMGADEELSTTDMKDALGEVVNILAGMMKTAAGEPGAKLGFPLFVKGRLSNSSRGQAHVAKIQLGPSVIELVVFVSRGDS